MFLLESDWEFIWSRVSRDGFISLAYLLGSDYTTGVKGVGIVNAMEILRAFRNADTASSSSSSSCKDSIDNCGDDGRGLRLVAERSLQTLTRFKQWAGAFGMPDDADFADSEAIVSVFTTAALCHY